MPDAISENSMERTITTHPTGSGEELRPVDFRIDGTPDGEGAQGSSEGVGSSTASDLPVPAGNGSSKSKPRTRRPGQGQTVRRSIRRTSKSMGEVRDSDRPSLSVIERANQYVADVLDGTQPTCKWTRLAVQRHVDDLAKQADFTYPFRFDEEAGAKACDFIELSPHVKQTKFAGKPLILQAWQCWLVSTAFGWLSKATGLRRFRETYFEISKGNGKSPLAAALCNYMAFAEGEIGAEVYTAATARQQARYVFDPASKMLQDPMMSGFVSQFGIKVGEHAIYQQSTNSFVRPLSREAKIVEGSLPYFTCLDELHEHTKRQLHDNLTTATAKRDGSILWRITTAGFDQMGVCFEQHEYTQKILEKLSVDETYFGCIWSIDEKDDPWSETSWRKANPNWGVSVNPDSFRQMAERAKQLPASQPAFMIKHLDVWSQADTAWMDMTRFRQCADLSMKGNEQQFEKDLGEIGADWANKIDLGAVARVYWRTIEAKVHYYVYCDAWTPSEQFQEGKPNAKNYHLWEKEGWLHKVPGAEMSDVPAEEFVRAHCKKFNILEIAHDPWGLKRMRQELQREGLTMIEIDQNAKLLSDPMKELEAAVYGGRFHYDGNSVLAWAVSNVVCHLDKNENYFPNKESRTSSKKIDPVSALLNAMNRVIALNIKGVGQPRRTTLRLI
jgi:phage terminase large subunit-like protein